MALSKKICILGDFAVGKTSLVRRYVLNQFSPEYQATLGVNIYKYSDEIETPAGGRQTINEIIWDIEGSQENDDLLDTYLRGAAGALVVGDLTRVDTLRNVSGYAERFLKVQPGRPLVFALNKLDLVDAPEGAAGGDGLGEEYGGPVLRTSAATGSAVPELFQALARRILEVGA